jgi:hypothetical protein
MGAEMPRPRKSLAAARLSGAYDRHPERYRGRNEPIVTDPLGQPPAWLSPAAQAAWRDLDREIPWLNRSHRGIMEIASLLQAKLAAGELGVPGMQLLRQCLNMLCATPTSRVPEVAGEAGDDPGAEFFR